MKKYLVFILTAVLLFALTACTNNTNNTAKGRVITTKANEVITDATKNTTQEHKEKKVKISIDGKIFSATLEDNAAANEFYELVKNEGITIDMSDYSGFEKVGALSHTLTSDDKQTTTKAGDIVLYQSNQIVMFYGSNSWSYTRLGRIDDLNGWEEALGSGDITAEFTS